MDYINANVSGAISVNSLASAIEELEESKQDVLVSGTNIKTVNENSLVGAGNLALVEGKLDEKLIATVAVGGVAEGTIFPAGTTFEEILRTMFKTNIDYAIFYGVSETIPTTVESTFTKMEIPDHFIDAGATVAYTSTLPLTEAGKYNIFIYPSNYGTLAHIYCNGLTAFDLINNWVCTEITYNGASYKMYRQTIPTKELDSRYQFLLR